MTAPTIATEPVKPTAPPKPAVTLAIDIDLSRQHLTVKEYGKVVGSWPISSGKDGHRTPTGVFRPSWMAKMWYSRKYDDAPMPHSVFFNDGIALHATQVTHLLGRPASHGCIRQAPANAARTYALVQKHGLSSTRVTVHGVARDTVPAYARSQGDTPRIARAVPTRSTYASSDRAIDSSRTYIPQVRQIVIVDSWGNRRVATVATSYARPVPATRQLYYPATIGRSYASGYR